MKNTIKLLIQSGKVLILINLLLFSCNTLREKKKLNQRKARLQAVEESLRSKVNKNNQKKIRKTRSDIDSQKESDELIEKYLNRVDEIDESNSGNLSENLKNLTDEKSVIREKIDAIINAQKGIYNNFLKDTIALPKKNHLVLIETIKNEPWRLQGIHKKLVERYQELEGAIATLIAESCEVHRVIRKDSIKSFPYYFSTGKSVLTADRADFLHLFKDVIINDLENLNQYCPKFKYRVYVLCEGYADSQTSSYNEALSETRAKEIASYLKNRFDESELNFDQSHLKIFYKTKAMGTKIPDLVGVKFEKKGKPDPNRRIVLISAKIYPWIE